MSQINALPINGFTIADLALLAPGPGQFLEVGGATEGRIDIDALAAYARVGTATESQGTLAEAALQPSDAGATGLALLATATAADARSAIGAMANTAPEITTNANGTAYRWPNGLQICMFTGEHQSATTAMGSLFRSASAQVWTFPAAFNTTPACFGSVSSAVMGRWYDFVSPTATSVHYIQITAISVGSSAVGSIAAIGTYTP